MNSKGEACSRRGSQSLRPTKKQPAVEGGLATGRFLAVEVESGMLSRKIGLLWGHLQVTAGRSI